MEKVLKKGAKLNSDNGIRKVILEFFRNAAEKQSFDAIMLPMKIPSGDSYAWIMMKDMNLLDEANPIAPIMPVNAANALKRYTRKGKGQFKVAALMRPCEIRATIELTKLKQVNLDDVTLFSYDCVGALPMQDYIADPKLGETKFDKLLQEQNRNSLDTKPICQICDKFSLSASDIHFGFNDGELLLIPNSKKGDDLLSDLKIKCDTELSVWEKNIEEITRLKEKSRIDEFKNINSMVEGFTNLQEAFSNCIGCHNCGSACPICYCRQCYFDSSVSKPNSDFVMIRAENRGSLSFPLDKIMFHVGRMSHMSLSCVSCGLCSDACPVDIPVARIFSFVATQTQKTFEYSAGENAGDALPIQDYKLEELGELGTLVKSAEAQEKHNE